MYIFIGKSRIRDYFHFLISIIDYSSFIATKIIEIEKKTNRKQTKSQEYTIAITMKPIEKKHTS